MFAWVKMMTTDTVAAVVAVAVAVAIAVVVVAVAVAIAVAAVVAVAVTVAAAVAVAVAVVVAVVIVAGHFFAKKTFRSSFDFPTFPGNCESSKKKLEIGNLNSFQFYLYRKHDWNNLTPGCVA